MLFARRIQAMLSSSLRSNPSASCIQRAVMSTSNKAATVRYLPGAVLLPFQWTIASLSTALRVESQTLAARSLRQCLRTSHKSRSNLFRCLSQSETLVTNSRQYVGQRTHFCLYKLATSLSEMKQSSTNQSAPKTNDCFSTQPSPPTHLHQCLNQPHCL